MPNGVELPEKARKSGLPAERLRWLLRTLMMRQVLARFRQAYLTPASGRGESGGSDCLDAADADQKTKASGRIALFLEVEQPFFAADGDQEATGRISSLRHGTRRLAELS